MLEKKRLNTLQSGRHDRRTDQTEHGVNNLQNGSSLHPLQRLSNQSPEITRSRDDAFVKSKPRSIELILKNPEVEPSQHAASIVKNQVDYKISTRPKDNDSK